MLEIPVWQQVTRDQFEHEIVPLNKPALLKSLVGDWAAVIAATLDHMGSFAHLANVVGPHLFDMFFDATLGNSDISTFMEDANPEAFAALKNRFEALDKAGLWVTRRNSIRASLEAAQ